MALDQELLSAENVNIALVGFGEAAGAFTRGWRNQGVPSIIKAYDIKTDSDDRQIALSKWDSYRECEVKGCKDRTELLQHPCLIFSLVTADQAHRAALEVAGFVQPGSIYIDCNSCAPGTKQKSSKVFSGTEINYVDAAIMAPVYPGLHKSPMLISGPGAEEAHQVITQLGMVAQPVGSEIGQASSVKMMRSIMMKGLEALTLECFLAARKAGIEELVLANLANSGTGVQSGERVAYQAERMTTHGIRRAAEMREVEKTILDLNLEARMTSAIVEWQQELGELGLDLEGEEFQLVLDRILTGLDRA